MIAKLVVWSTDRTSALEKLRKALKNYHIVGLKTNIRFLDDLAKHPEFIQANVHTGFIPLHEDELLKKKGALNNRTLCQASIAMILFEQDRGQKEAVSMGGKVPSLCLPAVFQDALFPLESSYTVSANKTPVVDVGKSVF